MRPAIEAGLTLSAEVANIHMRQLLELSEESAYSLCFLLALKTAQKDREIDHLLRQILIGKFAEYESEISRYAHLGAFPTAYCGPAILERRR